MSDIKQTSEQGKEGKRNTASSLSLPFSYLFPFEPQVDLALDLGVCFFFVVVLRSCCCFVLLV